MLYLREWSHFSLEGPSSTGPVTKTWRGPKPEFNYIPAAWLGCSERLVLLLLACPTPLGQRIGRVTGSFLIPAINGIRFSPVCAIGPPMTHGAFPIVSFSRPWEAVIPLANRYASAI
jgi:hypothetical protein